MSETIFYKIGQGEIPANVVYEDDQVMAFLDMSQVTKGHTLLIPKKAIQDIFAYTDDDAAMVFSRVPKITRAMQKAFPEMTGVNLLSNNGEDAFQSVFHSHIHIIPRYSKEDDGFGLKWETAEDQYSEQELAEIAQSIRQEIEEVD
ncbi:HIT family protein [Aerococcus kribbianus]|uniref:HIT family protein n=1 Tax=Aerococcus kribbianus TaxID=2999064 RepID=A0A9X3FNY2_9LACT|nr:MULTISPECIES: HIT family protein [unclassified Aerococcus]MCZ0717790.1 HIT family protein [Aerococcus sp. YH-aer221]MCZ0726077.1 HIT family protein [Aerococcus sp. YH-aer222]